MAGLRWGQKGIPSLGSKKKCFSQARDKKCCFQNQVSTCLVQGLSHHLSIYDGPAHKKAKCPGRSLRHTSESVQASAGGQNFNLMTFTEASHWDEDIWHDSILSNFGQQLYPQWLTRMSLYMWKNRYKLSQGRHIKNIHSCVGRTHFSSVTMNRVPKSKIRWDKSCLYWCYIGLETYWNTLAKSPEKTTLWSLVHHIPLEACWRLFFTSDFLCCWAFKFIL